MQTKNCDNKAQMCLNGACCMAFTSHTHVSILTYHGV